MTLSMPKDRCPAHGNLLVKTTSYNAGGLPVKEFFGCPHCNSIALDKLINEPGTIVVRNSFSFRNEKK